MKRRVGLISCPGRLPTHCSFGCLRGLSPADAAARACRPGPPARPPALPALLRDLPGDPVGRQRAALGGYLPDGDAAGFADARGELPVRCARRVGGARRGAGAPRGAAGPGGPRGAGPALPGGRGGVRRGWRPAAVAHPCASAAGPPEGCRRSGRRRRPRGRRGTTLQRPWTACRRCRARRVRRADGGGYECSVETAHAAGPRGRGPRRRRRRCRGGLDPRGGGRPRRVRRVPGRRLRRRCVRRSARPDAGDSRVAAPRPRGARVDVAPGRRRRRTGLAARPSSGVLPPASTDRTLAPWSSSTRATASASRRADACSGVTPLSVAAPTSAPRAASTAAAEPPSNAAAQCSGVADVDSLTSPSAPPSKQNGDDLSGVGGRRDVQRRGARPA